MSELLTYPLFPVEGLSSHTLVKLPKRPNASSGSVKLYIIFAEPHIFLEGFSKEEMEQRPPAVLRGCLFIRISKPVRIKRISLKLEGVSRTDWPEGIPPKKIDHMETKTVLNHVWSFFNHTNMYPVTENSCKNADLFVPKSKNSDLDSFALDSPLLSPVHSAATEQRSHSMGRNTSSSAGVVPYQTVHAGALKYLASDADIKPTKSHSSLKLSSLTSYSSHHSHRNSDPDNKLFQPGDYIYSFEQPFAASLPETMNLTFGSVRYYMEAFLERSGAFKSNLSARRAVPVIRTPCSDSSEENEPIVINRDWETRLHYEIVISSKQVILNSYLPISFKLTPLDKIRVHRFRIYITEHLEYYCHNKHVHRAEPAKKVLLLEHRPPEGCNNLLSVGGNEIGGVAMDFQVYVPQFYADRTRLHPDTSSDDIQAHHWIKICVRLSKSSPTAEDPDKRKHYELSIDSPIHLLSSHCAHANTMLPSYEEQMIGDVGKESLSPTQTDMNMTPRSDMILDSNMFEPDSRIPVEMLSPQARPFSPIVSPELNAINPELRDTHEMKPIDLLATLSATAPPPNSSFSGPPPPPFNEVETNPPPSYEEAVRHSNSSSSTGSSSKDGRMEILPDGRSRKEQVIRGRSTSRSPRNESSADLGDINGNFQFKVTPIRSRSPSASPPPNFFKYSARSKLVSSSMVPGLRFGSKNSSSTSQAIDEALDESDNGDEEGIDPLSPLPEKKTNSTTSPKDHTLSGSSTATLTPRFGSLITPKATQNQLKKLPISIPYGSDRSSSSDDLASSQPSTNLDPVATKPLLNSESDLLHTVDSFQPPSRNSASDRNGSIVTNLNYARDPDSSIDISTMLGSPLTRNEELISPVGFELCDPSTSDELNDFSLTPPELPLDGHHHSIKKVPAKKEAKNSHSNYGVEPIMTTLAESSTNTKEIQ